MCPPAGNWLEDDAIKAADLVVHGYWDESNRQLGLIENLHA